MNKIFAFTVLVNSVSIAQGTTTKLKKTQDNVFHQVHLQIHDTVNVLFRLLGLNANFTKNYKNNILLSMHNSMKALAEEIFLEHQHIKALASLKDAKKPKEGLFNLEKTIQIVIDETFKPITCKTTNNGSNINGVMTALTSLKIPDNSEESITFLKEYLYSVKGSEIYGLDSPTHKIMQFYEHYKLQAKKDIKTWHAPNSTQDLNKTLTRRIFNGTEVRVKKFPFMASLHVMGDFSCAASIITKEWAITAAVCLHIAYKNQNFILQNPNAIMIRIGSDYTVRFGQECAISNVVFHPGYDPETLRNNLALLKFHRKIHYRSKNKKIRKILYKSSMDGNVEKVLLLGWGSKDSQVSYGHDPLSSSFLDIYDIERCKKIYSSKFVSDSNFCAGFQNRGSGACQRDAGGPGIVNDDLVGVVSFGPPVCGTPDAPTVFTNIAYYRDWIDAVVNKKPYITTTETNVLANIISKKANIENPKLKLKPQKEKHKTGVRIRREEYPKVIRIVSQLLNNLIVGQDIESIAYEDSNEGSDSDDPADVVIGNNVKYPDDDITNRNKITTQITNDLLRNNMDTNIKPTSLYGQTAKSHINPYFSAANKLQGNLGLSNSLQAQSINVTNYVKSNGSTDSLQSATSNELAIESTDFSDSDVYDGGLSIEVSSETTTDLTVKINEDNQDLAEISSTPTISNTYLDEKNSTITIERINEETARKGFKTTSEKTRLIQPKAYTTYTSGFMAKLLAKKVLYPERYVRHRSTKSEEKINIKLSETKLSGEHASDSDDEDIKKDAKTRVNETVPKLVGTENMHDSSESTETTNEIQILAEQIRRELNALDLSSYKSTSTKVTNDNNEMGPLEKRKNMTELPININNNYEAFNEHLQLQKMGDTARHRITGPYYIEAENHHISKHHHRPKKQHVVENKHQIIGELQAKRKSFQDDELSQVEGEEVGRQLLDYINV